MGAEELLGALYAHEARAGSDAVEPEPPAHLVLVHEGVGVAVGDTVLVGEPLRALFAAQERRAGFKAHEPLTEVTACDAGYACNKILVRLQRAGQRQLAPPWGRSLLL